MTNDGAPVQPFTDPAAVQPERLDPRLARWALRVMASLLDAAIGTAVTFLALGEPDLEVPFLGAPVPVSGLEQLPAVTWTDSGWVVGVVLVFAAMQGYFGVTPGKMVLGIAVVHEIDARPVGLLRTLVRWFAHVIDSVLFIGYLRPLWNPRRQTFADSIMRTFVLVTRRPRRHPWVGPRSDSSQESADPGPPRSWEATTAPRWWRPITAVCAVLCAVGVLFSFDFSESASGPVDISCVLTAPDNSPAGLNGGSLSFTSFNATRTRLGVTREARGSDGPITATWKWRATLPVQGEMSLRSSFARKDGTGARQFDYPSTDPNAEEETMTLPPEALKDLGSSWTWTQTILVDGVESRGCTTSMPEAVDGVT